MNSVENQAHRDNDEFAQAEQALEKEKLNKTLQDLAALPPIEYDQQREAMAQKLGVRVSTLDVEVEVEVAKLRGGLAEDKADEVVEEIPPHDEPVDGTELLNGMVRTISRHVALPQGSATTLALWALGTYCMDALRLWPKLLFNSPEKRCGKSTAMEVLEGMSYRAMLTSNITASALFRCIEEWQPTLLIDEADTFTRDNDELNGIINAGHTRRTAVVIRSEREGDSFKPKKFSVWCPQALASIGKQRDTLHDRAVVVTMRRKLPTDTVEKLPVDYYERTQPLRRKCLRWASDNRQQLKTTHPEIPPCGNDRAQDNWQPLFAIAELAGGHWPEQVKCAYLKATSDEADEQTVSTLLLKDIKAIFDDIPRDAIFSEDLITALVSMEDRPWFEWKQGKPMTQNSLSRLLNPYKVKTKDVRIGETVKRGYNKAAFMDSFQRYIPSPSPVTPPTSATTLQTSQGAASSGFQSATGNKGVALANPLNPSQGAGCSTVALEKGETADGGVKITPELRRAAIAACDGLDLSPDQFISNLDPDHDYQDLVTDSGTARFLAEKWAGK